MRDYLVHLKHILDLWRGFPLPFCLLLLWDWVRSFRLPLGKAAVAYEERKHERILTYLFARYDHLVPSALPSKKLTGGGISDDLPVWCLWLQGEAAMPPLVRTCYESIIRHAGPHPVRLLTQETLAHYTDLPPHIYRLVERGCITRQHLSDLLRVSLLYTHGGIWMDLTIYVVRPLDTSRYNALWNTIKIHPQRPGTISRYRWAGFYEACAPGSEAMRSFRDVMFAYWETHTCIIDYLLIDYTFEMLYRKCPAFKQLVDEAPYGNERLYELAKILNEEYDPKYSSLFEGTDFFKLNWRIPLREGKTVFHCLGRYLTS